MASLSAFLLLAALAASLTGPPGPVDRGVADGRRVAFTVNVVWGTEYVVPIAQVFRQHGDRATFFLGGAWARAHPDVARRLAGMGMEIGSHGYAHRHVGSLTLRENLSEIDRAQTAIAWAAGRTPSLYAPAYGEVSRDVLEAAQARGMKVVMWTIDTIDWRTWHTPDIIERRVLERLRPGAFVLIHPTDRTLKALGPLLEELHRQGYRATTVSDLLPPSRDRTKALLVGGGIR